MTARETSGYSLAPVKDETDWHAYHEIRRRVLFEARGRHAVYDDAHPDEYKANHFPLLLKRNGQPLGTTRLDVIGDGGAIVRLVAIAEDERGRGHGRVLAAMVEDFARDQGVSELFVNAAPESVGYYEKLGWRRFDWDPAEAHQMGEPCIQMRKSLKTAAG